MIKTLFEKEYDSTLVNDVITDIHLAVDPEFNELAKDFNNQMDIQFVLEVKKVNTSHTLLNRVYNPKQYIDIEMDVVEATDILREEIQKNGSFEGILQLKIYLPTINELQAA